MYLEVLNVGFFPPSPHFLSSLDTFRQHFATLLPHHPTTVLKSGVISSLSFESLYILSQPCAPHPRFCDKDRSLDQSDHHSRARIHKHCQSDSNTMAFSGFLFICWRIFEIIMLLPPVGMLAWFVNGYVTNNQLTPNFVLVLFITTVLALAWAIVTLFNYLRARHDALFVAFIDLCFVGALIAGVVVLRFIANANCGNYISEQSFFDLGTFGYPGYLQGNSWASNPNKTCSMLKASFAFGIIDIIAFFVTFVSLQSLPTNIH